MANSLLPELTGRALTLDYVLDQPSLIRDQIARIADSQTLLPKFFHTLGETVTGGAMLYSIAAASDYFVDDPIEKRVPLAEYAVTAGVEPEPRLSLVEDYGCRFQISDEDRQRNNTSRMDLQTLQAANSLVRKLDVRALAAVEAAAIHTMPVDTGGKWDAQVLVGPLDSITESADRPTAHFARAQQLCDEDELGVVLDTLLVNPAQAADLKVAYAGGLDDVLKSAGLTMFTSARIAAGVAYLVQAGEVGVVGFEHPLTVEVIPERQTRSTWVQSFVVPALGVNRPHSCVKLTGLAS